MRYEHVSADAQTVPQAAGVAGAGPFSRTDNMVSGRAGLIWQPKARQSYYVSWGNSYNPSGELGVYGGTAQTNLNAVNQGLDPEKSQNYEIGAQWDVLAGFQLRASVLRNEKTNARRVDATGTTVLDGKRRVDGVELEASGSLSPNWDLYSGIAFMDGEMVTGRRTSRATRRVCNVFDKQDFIGVYNNSPNRVLPGAPLSAAVRLRYNVL